MRVCERERERSSKTSEARTMYTVMCKTLYRREKDLYVKSGTTFLCWIECLHAFSGGIELWHFQYSSYDFIIFLLKDSETGLFFSGDLVLTSFCNLLMISRSSTGSGCWSIFALTTILHTNSLQLLSWKSSAFTPRHL